MRQPITLYQPDGLSTGMTPPAPSRRKQASRAGQHARMRLASRTLEHLPMAVTVIDRACNLHFWNLHAASLLNLPPMMQDDMPPLAEALRDGGRLAPRQIVRIRAFCDAAIQAEGREPSSWLRLSLGRQHRVLVKLHGIGGDRWILGFEELHPVAQTVGGGRDAMVDPLTGLGNRRHFTQALQDSLHEDGAESPRAVLLIDLDRFQAVNDQLGREVGDAILVLVAQRLQRETRDEDVVARLGGDEFAVLQPNGEQAEALAVRIVAMLARPFMVEGHVINVGASVGVARAAVHAATADAVMKQADIALYAAKTEGRQTWRLFDPAIAHHSTAQRTLERDLRRALALGEFSLAFQPRREPGGRTLIAFSAVLRWLRSEHGAVPPAVFVPLAEQLGCIVELCEWTLLAACTEAAGWSEPLSVCVTVRPQQLDDPGRLFAAVEAALAATGLAPGRLELVLTCSLLTLREGPAADLMQRLRARGVSLAMTGFGVGWGALRHLRSFPFDRVKIDAALVDALQSDPETAAMVRAVTTLATDLGMAVGAAGVETPEQARLLEEQGCAWLEGGFAGEAMDAGGIAALLHGSTAA